MPEYIEPADMVGFRNGKVEVIAYAGKWLINSDGYYPYCSECKEEPKSGIMTHYCPNCGAKMMGKEDEI